ncbi:MAG: ABC transporter ATP-binding protein, partial [Clostridia bacterium]
MLKLTNITKVYGKDVERVEALRGVSVEFRRNEFVSILGPSGCGKTTLLNIIGGLDRYTDGDLVIENLSTKEFRESDWNNYRNKKIGFVFQSYNLIPHLSVLKNVEMALTIAGADPSTRKKKALSVLQKVGLSDKANKRPNQLSGGQMQRVAIARALVNEPEVILADEPTGALDSESGIQVLDLLKEVANDRLVIMVTHNGDLAEKYSTRIVRLVDGLVVEDSKPF